jgi:4-oxalocrotonate tautomerase
VEKIKNLIEKVTDTVEQELGAPRQSIRVIVTEIPKTHWGIAGVPVSDDPNRR